MEKDNLIKNKNARDEKTFKKRTTFINEFAIGTTLVGCAVIGAAIPLLLPVIGGALNAAGVAMATSGIIKATLIGGAVGATVGGGVVATVAGVKSFIKHKRVNDSIIKDENKTLKEENKTLKEENKSLAESLEKIDKVVNNKNQVKVSSPQEVNENQVKVSSPQEVNKNQVKVFSPQEVNENVEKGNELAK